MSSELDTIFNKISGWSVEEIQSIMYHEEWTREGENPFEGPGNPPKNSEPLFTDYRNTLKTLLGQDFKVFTTEKISKIIISSTFLLMNDESKVRPKYLSEWMNKKENRANLLQLLETMDKGWSASDQNITKLQLFYALCKQRENSKFKIKKVTWANVTSKWGPKIVMTDGESYYYIFNQRDDFKGRHERYNIAATLGQTEQYKSKYLEEKNHFNLNILKVNATSKCTTLAEYFQNKEMGSEKNESNRKLFERLSEEFFRNELEIKLVVATDELRKILPRLSQEENTNPCLSSVLSPEKEWVIPRTKVEADKQDFFVVHGDEWGGNFLVTESARQVFMIDFEDAIFANANQPETIIRVGGDLSSRIFSPRKNEDQKFHEIGLSIFASIGRLLAAIVQYHARNQELLTKNIKTIIINYVTGFENSLKEKNDILHGDHWTDFKQLILLHAWDWALYWRQKKKQVFPKKHFEEFVKEIKKLLFDGHEDRTDSVPTSLREDTTGPERMPSDNTEGRDEKTIEDRNIERADNDAWNFYVKGDMESAEIGWNDALQTLDASNSSEDKGYFTYWKTKAAYINNDDVSGAIESILQCIEFCKAEEDDAWLMDALLFLAYLRRTAGEIDQARHIIDQIVSLYHDGEFEEEPESLDAEQLLEWPEKRTPYYGNAVLCRIKRQVANFFWGTGDLAKSANLFENLMHYYVGVQKHYDADNARIILGILKSYLGEYEESDALQNQCLNYRRKEYAKLNDGDTREITKALRNLGQNAMTWAEKLVHPEKRKMHENAMGYFKECIDTLKAKSLTLFVSPEEKERFILFNESKLRCCELYIKIEDINEVYLDQEERRKLFEELLPQYQVEHITIRLAIMENIKSWENMQEHLDEIDYSKCTPKQFFKIAVEFMWYKHGRYEESRRLITEHIRRFDNEMKIQLCYVLEETHIRLHKGPIERAKAIKYHQKLCASYDIVYDSGSLQRMDNPDKNFETLLKKFGNFFRKGHSERDDKLVIAAWTDLETWELRELGLLLLEYLTKNFNDTVVIMKENGKTNIVDVHTLSHRRTTIEIAQAVFQSLNDFEDLFSKDGLLNLHMILFNIVVNAFQILDRIERIPARKTSLQKQMGGHAKRTKNFREIHLSESEIEIYKNIVWACVKPQEYPLVQILPMLLKKLQKCENERVKLQFLAIVHNIILISPIFFSPPMHYPPVLQAARQRKASLECIELIVGDLETWMLHDPNALSHQAYTNHDVRKLMGMLILKRANRDELDWPEIFKQRD